MKTISAGNLGGNKNGLVLDSFNSSVHSALSAVSGIHDQRGHEDHRKNIQCPY